MSGRVHRAVFWVGVVALCLAHVGVRVIDEGGPPALLGGWLPGDMAFHLAWIAVTAGWVLYMCGPVWREDAAQLDAANPTDARRVGEAP